MTDSLTARLLAEIERREAAERSTFPPSDDDLGRYSDTLAYLAALRKIVDRHKAIEVGDFRPFCGVCTGMTDTVEEPFPCPDVRAVAESLDVKP